MGYNMTPAVSLGRCYTRNYKILMKKANIKPAKFVDLYGPFPEVLETTK
jgi:hypothetical protein